MARAEVRCQPLACRVRLCAEEEWPPRVHPLYRGFAKRDETNDRGLVLNEKRQEHLNITAPY